MAENKLKIEIFRKKTMEELSSALADPECRAGCGSAAAAVASIAAALLCRAAKQLTVTDENCEQAEWFVRNTEIVRSYMTNLIDEDVKCHAPLRRAQKEGEERNIEASRQAAVSICLEIVNMMGQCLDLCEGMMPFADSETVSLLKEGAELAYGVVLRDLVVYRCARPRNIPEIADRAADGEIHAVLRGLRQHVFDVRIISVQDSAVQNRVALRDLVCEVERDIAVVIEGLDADHRGRIGVLVCRPHLQVRRDRETDVRARSQTAPVTAVIAVFPL